MKIARILKDISTIADKNEKSAPLLVGGAVRDLLLNKKPNDFDITTGDNDCLELADLFAKEKHIPLRISNSGAKQATYNGVDLDFSPHIIYMDTDSPLISEVFSRDYTINSMMIDMSNGDFIDLCGGLEDLKSNKLRCAISPEITFKNPANAIRSLKHIAAGFNPTKKTEEGIIENIHKWSDIPEKQARKILNSAIRENPEIVLWLKNRNLLDKLPITELLIDTLKYFRLLKHV